MSDDDDLAAAFGLPPEPEEDGGGDPRRSWRPVDLTAILDGTYEQPVPSVGARDDGAGLFYPGRLHAIAAESEAGKTWLAVAAAATELVRGHGVVYTDFEDDEGGITGRMLATGSTADDIRRYFAYIRPADPVTVFGNREDLAEVLADLKPSLVILDGVTEAMMLHGLELKDNTDVARFGRILPRWIAAQGPATVALDHVVKDREGRHGGYAIGGAHKLNGLNGAMYLLENRDPFGIGLTGRSRLMIRKDRPGQLRRQGQPSRDGLFWYADLIVASHGGGEFAEVSVPAAEQRDSAPFRPTVLMARICAALAGKPLGLSGNAIEGAVTGRREAIRYALETLVNEGYVAVEMQGSARMHKLVRPFTNE